MAKLPYAESGENVNPARQREERLIPAARSDDEMRDPGAYLRTVVRVFPDYAGTVLWFVGGPVDYADAKLSDSLAAAMQAWEESYYRSLDDDLKWRSPGTEEHHAAEGLRLARLLADELGDAFEVEVWAEGAKEKIRILGLHPGSNPAAVAAFRGWAAESEAEDERVRQLRDSGVTFGWTAYSPIKETQD